jgi:hypothetical protein
MACPALQFWDSVSTGIKPTQQGLTLQLNTSAGAVLPGKPLGSLLAVPGISDPSHLIRPGNKKLLAEAEALLKGAKVGVVAGCQHAMPSHSTAK